MAIYPWSSYLQYAGAGTGHQWLLTHEILSRFDGSRQAYREYTEEAIRLGAKESPREELKAGFVLGGEELVEKVGNLLKGNAAEQP